jgi:hypothetical protein
VMLKKSSQRNVLRLICPTFTTNPHRERHDSAAQEL